MVIVSFRNYFNFIMSNELSGLIQKQGTGGFMSPEKIINHIDIKEGNVVADFGCGAGYFAIPIARKVGSSGQVHAVDVLASALESVESKAKMEGLLNIKTVRANAEINNNSKLGGQIADFVILANILCQTDSNGRPAALAESKRVLKNNGQLVIIDWVPGKSLLGVENKNCVSEEEIKELAVKIGFRFERSFFVDGEHYGLLFTAR